MREIEIKKQKYLIYFILINDWRRGIQMNLDYVRGSWTNLKIQTPTVGNPIAAVAPILYQWP